MIQTFVTAVLVNVDTFTPADTGKVLDVIVVDPTRPTVTPDAREYVVVPAVRPVLWITTMVAPTGHATVASVGIVIV